MSNFAYSVAIKLSVANFASAALRTVVADLLKAHGAATSLQTKLSALKLAAVGYGFEKLGSGIYGFLSKSVDASKEYTRQLSLMTAAGMAQKDIAQATAAAWQTSRDVVTSTAADNLHQLRELRSLFGNQHMSEAYAVLPTVMRTQAAIEALTGRHNDQIGFEMAKVAELRQTGVMTLPFLQRNVDELSRTLMAMGGTLSTNDFLMTMKYAKTAALTFSDQFVYDYLPTIMQEVKGGGGGFMGNTSTAGTALMTLYSAIVQGKMPKASVPLWEAIGLIKPSDLVRNATGGFQLKPGSVEGAQLFQQNPYAWAQMIAPQIEHYAQAHHLNLTQVLSSMFGARNAQWMMNTLIAKAGQFERDRQLIESTPNSYASYQKLLATNPQLAHQAIYSQWQNVLARIGYTILPVLVPYMVKFANGLDTIVQWIGKHPNLFAGIIFGLGGLSIALMAIGKIMMTAAIIRFLGIGASLLGILTPIGLITVAIAGIGAVAYEAYKHWSQIKSFFEHAFDTSSLNPGGAQGQYSGVSGSWGSVVSGGKATVVYTQINLDGKKVSDVVTKHQGAAMSKPQTGLSRFDATVMPMLAGGGLGL